MKENAINTDITVYAGEYTEEAFWTKLKSCARKIGKTLLEEALLLYYVWKDADTPLWAKAAILSALGYLISPLDAIPDMIPIIGYTDDAAIIAAAIMLVNAYLKEEHQQRARAKLEEWFG